MAHTLSRISRFGLVAAIATTLAVTPLPAEAGGEGGRAGRGGVGDDYFPKYGNGGYDVRDYRINVRFDTETERLTGRTTIRMTPTHNLSRFNLDLVLRASEVTVDGMPATFTQTPHELKVTPARTLERGADAIVVVRYAGVPSETFYQHSTAWITTSDGAVALGEPESAAWWFPSNDHPTDKATYRVNLTVPTGTEAISVGRFRGKERKGEWTTWRWHLSSQAATYLVFAAIGDYEIEQGTSLGRPFLYAFGTDVGRTAKRSIRYTGVATEYLASKWGAYPFLHIGGVVPNDQYAIGFALETQTRPVYDASFFDSFSGTPNHSVVIHEMAHQWFGNSVALNRWKHIWLNEGFATYSEWMWAESSGGPDAQERFLHHYDRRPASDPYWDLRIGDPGPDRLFDLAVYDRGAMTAHALRNRLGHNAFFDIVREWLRTNADGDGSTKGFARLAERISGEDLNDFFDAWLYTGAKPARTAENGF